MNDATLYIWVLYKWHLCRFTSFTSYIKVVFVVYSWQFIWIANGKYNYPWPNLSTTYLVGSTYLFILPMHDSDQFFPSGVYYLLKGGRWLRSPLQNRKKTSICNHSDICTFKHYICIYSGTNQVHFPSSSTFKKQEDVIYLWQKPL